MDCVEQSECLARLVRLQPADLVKPNVGIAITQCRPFSGCFLDPILAEIALAGADQRLDLFSGAALADRNELNLGWIALRKRRGCGDAVAALLTAVVGAAHERAMGASRGN